MVPSVTESQIFQTLGDFLTAILPGGVVVAQGQANRVSTPADNNYVLMWPISRLRLSTNHKTYDPATATETFTAPTQAKVQIDFHGSDCADNQQIFTTLFRDSFAVKFFKDALSPVVPLYCGDGQQTPFINGEKQYENRWTVYAEVQINPAVSTTAQFADSIDLSLVEIDATYPPGG